MFIHQQLSYYIWIIVQLVLYGDPTGQTGHRHRVNVVDYIIIIRSEANWHHVIQLEVNPWMYFGACL